MKTYKKILESKLLDTACKSGLVAARYFPRSFYVLVQWIFHPVFIPRFVIHLTLCGRYCLRILAEEERIQSETLEAASDTPAQLFCDVHVQSGPFLYHCCTVKLIVTRHYCCCYIQSPVTSLWRYMSDLYGRGRELLSVCSGWLVIWLLYELSYLNFTSLPVNLRTTGFIQKFFMLITLHYFVWISGQTVTSIL